MTILNQINERIISHLKNEGVVFINEEGETLTREKLNQLCDDIRKGLPLLIYDGRLLRSSIWGDLEFIEEKLEKAPPKIMVKTVYNSYVRNINYIGMESNWLLDDLELTPIHSKRKSQKVNNYAK
jgi:hypothetical protein